MRLGSTIIQAIRTVPISVGSLTGIRSVWYLPGGVSIHTIERHPIPCGTYFMRPDETGDHRNWVIEKELFTRVAFYPSTGSIVMLPRIDIEMHPGNRLDETLGCPLPGVSTTDYGVYDSRVALSRMRLALERDSEDPPVWVLEISGGAE